MFYISLNPSNSLNYIQIIGFYNFFVEFFWEFPYDFEE